MDHNDELMHHGIKGMKWGVRRTPEQLGHRTASGVSGAAKTAKKAASSAAQAVRNQKSAIERSKEQRKRALVDKALSSNSTKKDLKKALPYMTDKDIQDKLNRNKLEAQLLNAGTKKENSALRKGMELGTTDAAKEVYGAFAKETLKPLATVAGKAAGQELLSLGTRVLIDHAAGRYGIDPEVAMNASIMFKESLSDHFAAAAAGQREKFKEKNSLGEAWEKGKQEGLAREYAKDRSKTEAEVNTARASESYQRRQADANQRQAALVLPKAAAKAEAQESIAKAQASRQKLTETVNERRAIAAVASQMAKNEMRKQQERAAKVQKVTKSQKSAAQARSDAASAAKSQAVRDAVSSRIDTAKSAGYSGKAAASRQAAVQNKTHTMVEEKRAAGRKRRSG